MATKERILALLRGEEAQRIRFAAHTTTGTITINRKTFAMIAAAISAGKIKITPQAVFVPGVGAEYHGWAVPGGSSGELLVPPIFGREQEGLTIHECIHAFFDLQIINVRATEEEAICYVVDALYFSMSGLTTTRWNNEPHATAKSVAEGLLRQYQKGDVPTPKVDETAWNTLVLAVAMNPTYLTKTAGLIHWFGGADSYTHDG